MRGAVEVERTDRGLRPHRLPAWARAQVPDAFMAQTSAESAGVRLAFRTAATTIELDVRARRMAPDAASRSAAESLRAHVGRRGRRRGAAPSQGRATSSPSRIRRAGWSTDRHPPCASRACRGGERVRALAAVHRRGRAPRPSRRCPGRAARRPGCRPLAPPRQLDQPRLSRGVHDRHVAGRRRARRRCRR